MLTFDGLDGALLIDKPAGPTSHDIVEHLRHHLGIKKIGHAGTLDPAATGLLMLLLGRGTKRSEKLMADDKVYSGWIKFGETTDSYDGNGELVASLPVPPMTLDDLNAGTNLPPHVIAVQADVLFESAKVVSRAPTGGSALRGHRVASR